MTSDAPRAFSLHDGGPFYRLMRRLHLVRRSGAIRGPMLALFAWVPLVAGEAARAVFGLRADPTLLDLSTHLRLLVAMPVMLASERIVESACRSGINSLHAGGLYEGAAIDAVVARGERLRDGWRGEALALVVALALGQLAFWRVTGPAGLFHGATGVGSWSFPHVWYCMVALPLALFVMLRWLWRWTIWSYMLVVIARWPLAALSTHPDRAAGLSCLARPVSSFGGFAFAVGAVLAGAWGTQLLAHRTTVRALFPSILAFLLLMLAIAVVPLLPFCRQLYRLRRRALAQYGDFAMQYMRGFHVRWIDPPVPGEQALGSPDIQSLNDIGGAYGVIANTRLFVFGLRSVLAMWLAALLPMAPILVSTSTVEQLIARTVKMVMGGVPL